jgi:hypothetical protein
MRTISVQQPWAELIASGVKTLEVRTWTTKHRGPLLIAASKAWSRHDAADRWRGLRDAPPGVAVCVVELLDVREGRRADRRATGGVDPTSAFVWQLRVMRRVEPFGVLGKLGLFEVLHPSLE